MNARAWRRGWTLVGLFMAALAFTGRVQSEDAPPATPAPPTPRGSLFGRVCVCGVPTAGHVEIRRAQAAAPAPGEPVATVKTDDRGSFRFSDVPPGQYEVRAIVAGSVPAFSWARIDDGIQVEVPVQAPGGPERLHGRARWPDGSPFRGVIALGWWQGWAHFPRAQTDCQTFVATDAEGRFRFDGVKRGIVSLEALAPSLYSGRLLSNLSLPTGDIDVVVATDALRVRGRVVDAATGAPVSSGFADVKTWTRDWSAPLREGAFELFVPEDADAILARAKGYARSRVERADVMDGLVVRLERGFTIEGTASDAQGRPVAGVRVFASREAADWDTVTLVGTTDEHGRYRIEGLPRGDPVVYALGAGYVARGAHPWSKEGPEKLRLALDPKGPARRDFVLEPAGAVRVRVIDSAGRSVPRASAFVAPESSYFDLWDEAGDLSEARADDGGVIEFKTIVPELEHSIQILAVGHAPLSLRGVVVRSGATLKLDALLPAPRWFDVEVLDDANGKPISGAALSARYRTRGGTWDGDARAIHWLTDAEGRAHVGPLGAGDPGVEVVADGFAVGEHPDSVLALDEHGVTRIRLKAGAAIAGRVESPVPLGGRPIEVRVRRKSTAHMSYGSDETHLTTLEGLRFRTASLEGDAYVLKASARLGDAVFEAQAEATTGTDDIVLRLQASRPHEVRLRVLDTGGRPIPSASAVIYPLRLGFRGDPLRVTIRSGEAVKKLPSDVAEVSVEVSDAKDADGRPMPLAAAMLGPVSVGSEAIELRLAAERPAGGVVRDTHGTGVAGVVVRAIPVRSQASAPEPFFGRRDHSQAITGSDGRFVLHGLGVNPYQLHFVVPEAFATPDPVSLSARVADSVEVVLEVGTSVTVRVVDSGGHPVAGAHLSLWWWTAGPRPAQFFHLDRCTPWIAQEDGTVRLFGLRPGRHYNLSVGPPDTRKDLATLDRDRWWIDEAQFQLLPRRRFGGVVRDPAGVPIREARVGWRRPGTMTWQVVFTDAQGKFEVEDVGEGAVFVRSSTAGPFGPFGRSSSSALRLTLDTVNMLTFESTVPHPPVKVCIGGPGVAPEVPENLPQEHGSSEPTVLANLDHEGTYSAYFGPTIEGRFFYAGELRADGRVVPVVFTEGPVLRARILGLAPASHRGLEVGLRRGALTIPLALAGSDAIEGVPLPLGTRWTLFARGAQLASERTMEFDVSADTTVVLDVR